MAPRGKPPGKQPAQPRKRERKKPAPSAKSAEPADAQPDPLAAGNPRALAAFRVAEGVLALQEIAVEAGVHRDTLLAWRKQSDFIAEVRAARSDLWADLRGPARERLRKLLEDPKPAVAFGAIDRIYGLGDFAPAPLVAAAAAAAALGVSPGQSSAPIHGVMELPMLDPPPVHPDDEVTEP